MAKVFISHASADKKLIDGFFDLLQVGCNLDADDIFCSSAEGYGIKTGEDFIREVGGRLREAELVILMLSPNYFASPFCVAEMGAAWILGKRVFPITYGGAARDPGVVFAKTQAVELDATGLDKLHEMLVDSGFMDKARTARWNAKKDPFLVKVGRVVRALPVPDLVRRSLLDEASAKAGAAITLMEEERARLEALQTKYDEVAALKDRGAVQKVELKHAGTAERYRALVEAVREALEDLSPVEVRCVYATVAKSPWVPDNFTTWREEIQEAIDRKRVDDEGETGWVLTAKSDSPPIKRVLQAINRLAKFMSRDEFEPLAEHLESRLDCIPDVSSRDYFEKELTEARLVSG